MYMIFFLVCFLSGEEIPSSSSGFVFVNTAVLESKGHSLGNNIGPL